MSAVHSVEAGVGRAHGKAILLGEHAVVYGTPALAIPLPELTVVARAHLHDETFVSNTCCRFVVTGNPDDAASGVQLAAAAALRYWGRRSDAVDITVEGAVPAGRGLGSSAAGAIAVVRAVADLYGANTDAAVMQRLAQHGEQMAHGRASGVDAAVASSTVPLWFEAGQSRPLPVGLDAVLVIADSGITGGALSAVAVAAPALCGTGGVGRLARAAELVRTAAADLATGRAEALGNKLIEFHGWLREVGVSCGELDNLVTTAVLAGALGAKLTGGGRGGCVLALTTGSVQAATVCAALTAAGAAQTWTVPVRRSAP